MTYLKVVGAAYAAKSNMMSKDGSHYTRATGKQSKPSYGLYSDSKVRDNDNSTIYTIEDSTESTEQSPLGCLTTSQRYFINEFLGGLCSKQNVDIDNYRRAIHLVGEWRSKESHTTIICTAAQPNITNAVVHIKGIPTGTVMSAKQDYIAVVGGTHPIVNTMTKCPQPQGAIAVPFTDYMLERKVISKPNINWSNMIFSNTQLIFIIIMETGAYECVLTHTSCNIMSKVSPVDAAISPPKTNFQSYSFRRLSITYGVGSGPSLTIHRTGTMQCQGRPEYIRSITSNFRECINNVLVSDQAHRFISSLGIIRDVSEFMPEM
jgi:hypothetical protein